MIKLLGWVSELIFECLLLPQTLSQIIAVELKRKFFFYIAIK